MESFRDKIPIKHQIEIGNLSLPQVRNQLENIRRNALLAALYSLLNRKSKFNVPNKLSDLA